MYAYSLIRPYPLSVVYKVLQHKVLTIEPIHFYLDRLQCTSCSQWCGALSISQTILEVPPFRYVYSVLSSFVASYNSIFVIRLLSTHAHCCITQSYVPRVLHHSAFHLISLHVNRAEHQFLHPAFQPHSHHSFVQKGLLVTDTRVGDILHTSHTGAHTGHAMHLYNLDKI